MALTASVTIKGYVQGYAAGRMEIDSGPTTTATAVPTLLEIVLANGNNTISVPTGATYVVISLDPASTRTKILKGVNADTGIQIANSGRGGTMILKLSNMTSFVINSSGADTGIITRFQFF